MMKIIEKILGWFGKTEKNITINTERNITKIKNQNNYNLDLEFAKIFHKLFREGAEKINPEDAAIIAELSNRTFAEHSECSNPHLVRAKDERNKGNLMNALEHYTNAADDYKRANKTIERASVLLSMSIIISVQKKITSKKINT